MRKSIGKDVVSANFLAAAGREVSGGSARIPRRSELAPTRPSGTPRVQMPQTPSATPRRLTAVRDALVIVLAAVLATALAMLAALVLQG